AGVARGLGGSRPTAAGPLPDKAMPAKDAKKPNKERPNDAKEITVAGRVLDPAGKPVAGATLFTPKSLTAELTSLSDIGVTHVGQTAEDGTFRVTLNPPATFPLRYLGVFAEGGGVDWIHLEHFK